MDDLTLDVPVDGTTLMDQGFLNKNIRDAITLQLAPPTAILKKTNNQMLATGAWNAISWNTLIADTEDPANPIYSASNPTRLTCRTAGWYKVVAGVPLDMDVAANTLTVAFQVNANAALIYGAESTPFPSIGPDLAASFTTIISLALNDYVELIVRHSRTIGVNSFVSYGLPRISFRRVRGI